MYLGDTPLKQADNEKSYLNPPPYHIFFLLGGGRRNIYKVSEHTRIS